MSYCPVSVLVIGVNYRTNEMAVQFARSVASAARGSRGVKIHLSIVDNSGTIKECDLETRVKAEYEEAQLYWPTQNLGYFGGANFGLARYLEHSSMPDWVIVANVDIEFSDDFFGSLSKLNPGSIGVAAPSIWSERYQSDRNPYMVCRPESRTMHSYKYIYRFRLSANFNIILGLLKSRLRANVQQVLPGAWARWLLPRAYGAKHCSDTVSNGEDRCIYAPHGSCMVLSRLYFLSGGTLAYPCFLYGEELFIAETARRLELKVVYIPNMKIHHSAHASTGLMKSRRVTQYLHQSAVYIADEYFS